MTEKKDPKKVSAGRSGGVKKSEAKAAAARRNGVAGGGKGGRNGGRPAGIPTAPEVARKAAIARANKLTPERRSEIARLAVAAREAKRKKSEQ